MRIVVVGATGNIGTALLRAAADRSSVTSIDAVSRRGPGRLPSAAGPVQVRHHRLDAAASAGSADDRALRALAAGADAVVHLAWSAGRKAEATSTANAAITAGVLRAAAGARQVVAASGAIGYAPSFGVEPRSEDWPFTGVPGSAASLDKVGLEHRLDEFADRHPEIAVTRLRPVLTVQESAGAELARRQLGPFVPRVGLGRHVPVLIWPEGLALQLAHAEDVAAAFLAAVERRAPGAYNVASPQVLDGEAVAEALGADRLVEVPRGAAKVAHETAWWLHLVRARADLLTELAGQPMLDTSRTRDLLGLEPAWTSADALRAVARGLAKRREGWTPALSR